MVKFVFSHLKLRKQPFLLKFSKSSGAKAHPSDAQAPYTLNLNPKLFEKVLPSIVQSLPAKPKQMVRAELLNTRTAGKDTNTSTTHLATSNTNSTLYVVSGQRWM